jgi:hypothetical protein
MSASSSFFHRRLDHTSLYWSFSSRFNVQIVEGVIIHITSNAKRYNWFQIRYLHCYYTMSIWDLYDMPSKYHWNQLYLFALLVICIMTPSTIWTLNRLENDQYKDVWSSLLRTKLRASMYRCNMSASSSFFHRRLDHTSLYWSFSSRSNL